MFKKLLVSLDGSAESAVALPLARTMARATGAEIVLTRVVPPSLLGPGEPPEREAAMYLAGIVDEFTMDGLRATTLVAHSNTPAAALVELARAHDADLVVMATHGRSGLQRAFLGSVAEHVLADSPVPVLMVRPGGRRASELTTLLVPVDGTPAASTALSAAVPLARAAQARIVLVQAVPPFASYYVEPGFYADPVWETEALAAAQTHVQGLAGRLQQAGLPTEGRAVSGFPSSVIAEIADEVGAQLIVMSTHARTGASRTVLGSVADEVVRTAHRPVLLLRQQQRSPLLNVQSALRV